ncbi:septation protein SepH [Kocuria sp.]|uniref:septation protein SepH n=1 Tax=Kocuria sp. TaxID=1871328 RepID=UPI0026E0D6FD|nr:septation protein SepH [Kocuria sp.]MDO5619366.1 septation protein SepH [Kocuria sp.]
MEELRLVGVHDDGEHLIVQDASGRRFLLPLDQQLRGTVQRARRVAPRRNSGTSATFGPRDIQARFRAGATVDEIVEESGWEAARVKRYEWPILAERAHVAREAQKVELLPRTPRSGSFRSVFDGEPQTLAQTITSRSADLGIATTSLDWDAWQRPDQQWQISVRFRISNPSAAPQDVVDQEPAAQWIFNPASLTVAADNQWARRLTDTAEDHRGLSGSDSLFGAPTTDASTTAEPNAAAPRAAGTPDAAGTAAPANDDGAVDAATAAEPSTGATQQPTAAPREPATASATPVAPQQDTDELLDVLDARRGQRIGQDTESDDHLAEILGRNMGHVDRRPRPISAPQDSALFDRPAHPAYASAPDAAEPTAGADGAQANTTGTSSDSPADVPPTDAEQTSGAPTAESEAPEATIHHLGRADERVKPSTPVVEITDEDHGTQNSATVTPLRQNRAAQTPTQQPGESQSSAETQPEGEGGDSAPGQNVMVEANPQTSAPQQERAAQKEHAAQPETPTEGESDAATDTSAATRPRPRGKVGTKRSRSSVPSWDEIVFGAKTDD